MNPISEVLQHDSTCKEGFLLHQWKSDQRFSSATALLTGSLQETDRVFGTAVIGIASAL